jgi:GT2 family glycosyltransferase
MHLSILIVSYNTRDLTLECLQSVFKETKNIDIDYEVIVVDNASDDHTAKAIAQNFPHVRLICSDVNFGFARANNLAARYATGEYLLLLNPDTVILNRAIEKLLEFARAHPDAGIYGGRTIFPDGTLNPTCCFGKMTVWSLFCRAFGLSKVFKKTTFFNPELYGSWKFDSVKQVDIITGCFLMVRHDLWNRLGGFNTVFFMFGEEVDFCLRAAKLGYKPLFTPDAEIVHHGGASETIRFNRFNQVLRSECTIIREHWSGYRVWLGLTMFMVLVKIKSLGYFVLSKFNPRKFSSQADMWNKLWRQRKEWLKGWDTVGQQ